MVKKMTNKKESYAPKLTGTLPVLLFLLTELVLYLLILFAGGKIAVFSSFGAIVLCLVYGLLHLPHSSQLLLGGLAMTVAADFCLVICDPRQQLWGMVFFLAAQIFYAARLHAENPAPRLLFLRLGLTLGAIILCVLVLGKNTDGLALISLCYYANLVMNLAAAFSTGKKYRLLAIGFVLFLLCDTIIGLQEGAKGYLYIAQDTWLDKLLFMDFNLPWVFYLPSQVCIALSSRRK